MEQAEEDLRKIFTELEEMLFDNELLIKEFRDNRKVGYTVKTEGQKGRNLIGTINIVEE
jgi:hypothetical protein